MINFLEGILVEKHPMKAVLLCGGIGYELLIPLSTFSELPEVNVKVRIITYLHIREDNWQIFGFHTEEERELFKLLKKIVKSIVILQSI